MTDTKALTVVLPDYVQQAVNAYGDVVLFVKSGVMKEGTDYGVIPGTGNKPTLLKPGAEKLNKMFRLYNEIELIDRVERWEDDSPLFAYTYKTRLIHRETGQIWGEGIGSCNSKEDKYAYQWITAPKPDVATVNKMKAAKTGRNRKVNNEWEWQERIPVPSSVTFSIANTINKMAQKRSYIAATLAACAISEFFTQDVEDLPASYLGAEDVIDGETTQDPPANPTTPTTQPPLDNAPSRKVKAQPATASPVEFLAMLTNMIEVIAAQKPETMELLGDSDRARKFAVQCKNALQISDDDRHAMLYYIFGKTSSKDITEAAAIALETWWQRNIKSARELAQAMAALGYETAAEDDAASKSGMAADNMDE